jgi:putative iron-dependent peroxidase
MGDLLHLSRQLERAAAPALKLVQVVDGFTHARRATGAAHDLTGYEDGTENPDEPASVALVQRQGPGLTGGSLLAVQQWQHQWARIAAMGRAAQDQAIGRRQSDNRELEDAPASAHVKRTEQESFAPPAFVWRRSMPWAKGQQGGLMFLAFGRSLDAFEAQMRRMAGGDDGVVDAVFRLSRPVTGATLWCPPMRARQLDLRALGV